MTTTPTAPLTSGAEAGSPTLPPALAGLRFEFDSRSAGRLSCYAAGPTGSQARPLLLIHSINAAASACEVRPLFEHYAVTRPVYAIDLPGFGFSERSDRPYTLRLMTDAVLAAAQEVARHHPGAAGGVDALALSLSCEYLARAASEQPIAFHTVGLVSPTGFNRRAPSKGSPGSSRGMPWFHRLLTSPRWTQGIYRNLTRPGVIRFFLEKTWGSKQIDEGLMAYDVITARQPGARHAPLSFVSGFLFSGDATQIYDALRQPVWVVHGVRGDFTDYRYKAAFAGKPNWHFTVLPTGALPHFEVPADFTQGYDAFLAASESAP